MERFLLVDASCSTCTKIAKVIEPEAHGLLKIMSLRNPDMQALLEKSNANWTWKPTLLEIEGERIRAFAGWHMAIRFLLALGPIRTASIAFQLHKEGVLLYAVQFPK